MGLQNKFYMKNNYIFISVLCLLLSSCDNTLDEEIQSNEVTTRAAGDGANDLLGYGYDCTQSDFKESQYSKAPIIDIERFKSGRGRDPITKQEITRTAGIIIAADLHGSGETVQTFGANIDEYTKEMSNTFEASYNLGTTNLKLFSARLKTFFKDEKRYDSKSCFYRIESIRRTRKLTMSNVYPEQLKYFLTDGFLDDLSNYNGDQIVEKYGTHVLTDIMLGGTGSLIFNSKIKSERDIHEFKHEAEAMYAGVKASNITEGTKDSFKKNKDVQIVVNTVGGTVPISANLSFHPETGEIGNFNFDFRSWESSVTKTSEQLIGIGNNTTKIRLISEFISDPAKKAEVERAIIDYCERQYIDIINDYNIDYETGYLMTYTGKQPAYQDTYVVYWNVFNSHMTNISHINGAPPANSMFNYEWVFFPVGEYYLIGHKHTDGKYYCLHDSNQHLPEHNEASRSQLYKVERLLGGKVMLRNLETGKYYGHNLRPINAYNPNDPNLWFKIQLKQ